MCILCNSSFFNLLFKVETFVEKSKNANLVPTKFSFSETSI